MGKRIFYHGTSIANLPDILKNGIQPVPSSQRIWNDSYPNLVYLWDDEKAEERGLDNAKESGAFSTALFGKEQRIVVFKIEMPDKYVDPDTSGEGMEDQGAVQTQGVPRRYITEYYVSENIVVLSSFILMNAINFPNSNYRCFSDIATRMSKRIQQSDIDLYWLDELFEIDWETVILKSQRHGQSTRNTTAAAI